MGPRSSTRSTRKDERPWTKGREVRQMARIFKVTIVSYQSPHGRKCKKDEAVTANGDGKEVLRRGYKRHSKKSTNWYGKFRNAAGQLVRVALCPDKTVSAQILASMIAESAKGKHGLVNPFERHRSTPLRQHLDEFTAELISKGGTEAHRKQVVARLLKVFEGCEFKSLDELSATRVNEWLNTIRDVGRPRLPLDPNKQLFTMSEAAVILNVKPPAIRALVHQHRLEAQGQGKARRLPRATIEKLQDRLCRGISRQTSNYYVGHLKSFGAFLVRHRRLEVNPFAVLQKDRKIVDRRHNRRDLTADEMQRLLTATRQSKQCYRGLSGEDRAVLYITAASTGFRASALANLTPNDFKLNAIPAIVTLSARFNKNRKDQLQPLSDDAADSLREFLDGKCKTQQIWGGTWASDHRGAEMLRIDLAEAGIPYVVEGPDGPRYADFHSLRHTYLTLLGLQGADLRTVQELAGHSSPALTAKYSHRRLQDLAAAVQTLPRFTPNSNLDGNQLSAEATNQVCPRLDQTADTSGPDVAHAVTQDRQNGDVPETKQPPVSQGFSHQQAQAVTSVQERGRRDSNPQPPDRQSGTLTN